MIVHLRIYEDLTRDLSLSAYQLDKKEHDELEYFQWNPRIHRYGREQEYLPWFKGAVKDLK